MLRISIPFCVFTVFSGSLTNSLQGGERDSEGFTLRPETVDPITKAQQEAHEYVPVVFVD